MFLETVIFIVVIILLITVLQLKKSLTEKLDFLYLKIEQLSKQLEKTGFQEIKTETKPEKEKPDILQEPFKPFTPYAPKDVFKPEAVVIPEPEQQIVPEPAATVPEEIATAKPEPKTEPVAAITAPVQPRSGIPPFVPPPVKKPSFSERNPDLEKFIGENLFNKIGIVILVLGMGFFLKYAIDKDWINEIGRTSIGFVCGGILIALAHKLRKSFSTFSSVLVGGGIAILYFTVTIGFHQYQLFSQTMAFILTILITGFTVLLAISYNRKELALFAILGGFGAPFMVSTGEGNYIVLFTYILTLNIGMLVLAYYKKWPVINIVCYLFTLILFGGWLLSKVLENDSKVIPYAGALIFASLFYLVFLIMNIINNIKEKTEFNALEIGILLSNTFLYYTAGMLILSHLGGGDYRGLFTALIGVVNLAFAYALYKNDKIDRNLIYLLIGLVLTFISLAAPVQLKGNQITLFWAAESVLLLWLSQKSGITLIKQSSVIVLVLMAISLVMDWQQVYGSSIYNTSNRLPILINKGFITGLVVVIALTLYSGLLRSEIKSILFREVKTSRTILAIAAIVIGYLVIALELNQQACNYFPLIRILALACYSYLFLCILLVAIRNAETEEFKFVVGTLAAVCLFCYILLFNPETIALRNSYLEKTGSLNNYLFHYLMVVLIGCTIYSLYKTEKRIGAVAGMVAFQWFSAFMILYVASAELDHLLVMSQYTKSRSIAAILDNSHKTGFAILWGCFALLCIYIGMKWKSKNIRIISITLLALTLLKLFIFDLRGLSEGGKIAAFISLGILLLVISFMYQRLKNLLLASDTETPAATDIADKDETHDEL
ncbi:DUF2339 domain-containing protein [Pedobacter heparinus]|uniref:Membrane protein n=1 Tax=Pedobacter heparinus (strain ATCC 13125 / DSM 2366 / CIP 104194 / JCM 7457 / NBRC 12017 / NCIMB 9290 / NRRL B-14731 / HIM 762-3) TaxID=485917 RepID=C6Y2G3_PEDHD|nr:DUF2339 domain-containing protein [Pedobacter heparinus]ACU05173.1 membrane protein [Pedobacter heparinus DSM 2366]